MHTGTKLKSSHSILRMQTVTS